MASVDSGKLSSTRKLGSLRALPPDRNTPTPSQEGKGDLMANDSLNGRGSLADESSLASLQLPAIPGEVGDGGEDLDELLREGEAILDDEPAGQNLEDVREVSQKPGPASIPVEPRPLDQTKSKPAGSFWGAGFLEGISDENSAAQPGDAIPIEQETSIKTAVELLLEAKVQQHNRAARQFRRDIAMLCLYIPFLVIFTISALRVDNTVVWNAQLAVEESLESEKSRIDGISQVDDIYKYLEEVLIPVISSANMTKLDARCTADGGNIVAGCSFEDATLVSGGNHRVTSVKLRQMRVQTQSAGFLAGSEVATYPPLSPSNEETRDGAGTGPSWDPDGDFLDWPADRDWYAYQRCTTGGIEGCFVPDEGAYYRGRYSRNGYIAELTGHTEEMLAVVSDMRTYHFLSSDTTRALFVDFTVYMANRKLFAVVTVLFEMTEFGNIISGTRILITDFHQSSDQAIYIIEYVVYGYAALMIMIDLTVLFMAPRKYLGDGFGWRLMSWLNYSLFIAGFIFRLRLQGVEDKIANLVPLTEEANDFPWQEASANQQILSFITAFNALLTWLRLLRYIEAISPRTRELTLTISNASSDLSTLLILFIIIFVGYSLAFYLVFGSQVEEFSRFFLALGSLFKMILGSFNYEDLIAVSEILAPLMFVSYIMVVYFLMLNMILAVVMKTYEEVQNTLKGQVRTEVTGTGLIKHRLKDFRNLIMARDLEEMRQKKGTVPSDRAEWLSSEEAILLKDFVTKSDIEMLFRTDPEVLGRLHVDSFGELMHMASQNGSGQIPTSEVRAVMLKDPLVEKRMEEEAKQADERMVNQTQAVDKAVEATVKRLLAEQRSQMEQFLLKNLQQLASSIAEGQQERINDREHLRTPEPPGIPFT